MNVIDFHLLLVSFIDLSIVTPGLIFLQIDLCAPPIILPLHAFIESDKMRL
jgi:hypothetical protein